MKLKNLVLIVLVVFVSLMGASQVSYASGEAGIKPEAPVIATTCGQSPGALMIRLICKRAKVKCDQNDVLTANDLKDKKYKTLIITMGTSLKGMGAAGTDIYAEVKRIKGVIDEAKKQGMTLIGAHIEGMARRVDKTDEISIDTVAPVSDIIMVKEESDSDGFFTKVAKEKNVPIYSTKETLDLVDTFKELFKTE